MRDDHPTGGPWQGEAEDFAIDTEEHLKQIGKACPVCPTCKVPLIARLSDRRFMEDNRYVECLNGHVWWLADPDLRERIRGGT